MSSLMVLLPLPEIHPLVSYPEWALKSEAVSFENESQIEKPFHFFLDTSHKIAQSDPSKESVCEIIAEIY